MIFLTDTCFWRHVRDIQEAIAIDLREILSRFQWGLSEALLGELTYFLVSLDYLPQDYLLVPVSGHDLDIFRQKYPFFSDFDLPDQNLCVSALRDGDIILTDDRELFQTAQSIGIQSLLLPHFCLLMVRQGFLDKRTMARIIRHFNHTKRFSQKKIARLNAELQEIQ